MFARSFGRVAFGLCLISAAIAGSMLAAKAETHTECDNHRCVAINCVLDGDARNCWPEAVYQLKPGEGPVHRVCSVWGFHCHWVRGPEPPPND